MSVRQKDVAAQVVVSEATRLVEDGTSRRRKLSEKVAKRIW